MNMNTLTAKYLRTCVMKVVEEHPKAVLAGLAIYIISPIDLLPEAFLGPLGTFDDILAVIAGVAIIKYLGKKRASLAPKAASVAVVAPRSPVQQSPRPDGPRRNDRFRRNDQRRRPDSRS